MCAWPCFGRLGHTIAETTSFQHQIAWTIHVALAILRSIGVRQLRSFGVCHRRGGREVMIAKRPPEVEDGWAGSTAVATPS